MPSVISGMAATLNGRAIAGGGLHSEVLQHDSGVVGRKCGTCLFSHRMSLTSGYGHRGRASHVTQLFKID